MDRAVEVAIALVLVFFLGGLICSALNEFVAAAVGLRARFLEKGIRHLLADDAHAAALYKQPLIRSLCSGKRKPSYIPSGAFATSVFDLLVPLGKPVGGEVQGAIDRLPPGAFKDSLTSLWRTAEGDLKKFRAGIETWFDHAMDRVGGWYRRRVQVIVLVFGFVVAIGLNVNTVVLVERLWNDDVLRAAVVERAGTVAQEGQQEGQTDDPRPPGGTTTTTSPSFDHAARDIEEGVEGLRGLDLPIGWGEAAPDSAPIAVVGWLISGLAFSFGAPFWFDLLSRVAPLRASGKPVAGADAKGAATSG